MAETKAHSTRKSTSSASAAEDRGPVCATTGCKGYRDQHAIPGNTCWCAIDCPCTRYAPSKAEIKAREAAHATAARQYTDEELTGMTINSEVIPTDAHHRSPGAAGASALGGGTDATSVDGTGGDSTTGGTAGMGAGATNSGTTTSGGTSADAS